MSHEPIQNPKSKIPNRREFLLKAGNYVAFGVLGAAAVALLARTAASGGACSASGLCARCGRQGACALPQALAYRQEAAAGGREP
ncbi:MAG: hypothetical protein NTW87_35215 [Planctomycetota bacterium]|nr:hypothetical protein [Planctomycetota bacterium]